jgi:hypothetical protein
MVQKAHERMNAGNLSLRLKSVMMSVDALLADATKDGGGLYGCVFLEKYSPWSCWATGGKAKANTLWLVYPMFDDWMPLVTAVK